MLNEITRVGRFDARARRGGRGPTGHRSLAHARHGRRRAGTGAGAGRTPGPGSGPAAGGARWRRTRRSADRRAVERCHSARHGRSRHARAQGVEPPRRVGRHQDGGWRRAQELGGLSRTRTEGRRRPRHPRHPRDVRHGPRARRPVGAGRLHRRRARLPVGEGAERRRDRIARQRRRQDHPGAHTRRRRRPAERGDGVPGRSCRPRTARPVSSASAGAARAASGMPRRSRRSMPPSSTTATRPARRTAHRRPRWPT